MAKRTTKRKNRKQKKGDQDKVERIMPTPERIAKGDLEFGGDKMFRSNCATEIDRWCAIGILGHPPKNQYRQEAFVRIYSLSTAISMFTADVMKLETFFTKNTGSMEDSALDKFRRVIMSLQNGRNRDVVLHLCAHPDEYIPFSSYVVQEALDDLGLVFEKMDRYAA